MAKLRELMQKLVRKGKRQAQLDYVVDVFGEPHAEAIFEDMLRGTKDTAAEDATSANPTTGTFFDLKRDFRGRQPASDGQQGAKNVENNSGFWGQRGNSDFARMRTAVEARGLMSGEQVERMMSSAGMDKTVAHMKELVAKDDAKPHHPFWNTRL